MRVFCLRLCAGLPTLCARTHAPADDPLTLPEVLNPDPIRRTRWSELRRQAMIGKIAPLVLAAVLAGCSGDKASSAAPEANPPSYQTGAVEFRTVPAELMLPATIQSDPEKVVHVFAPVSGRLVALRVKTGDQVRAGQAVAVVQSSDAASARSDYQKAKAQSDHSSAALKRVTQLYEHGATAAKDLEDAKAQAASDTSDLARTKERLEMLGLSDGSSSDKVTVAAPRAGVVIETTSATGEFSKSLDASNPLLTIADLSSVWVVGSTYERDLEAVSRGESVEVTAEAYPSQTWRSQIAYVSDIVDPNTRTVKVRVVLKNLDHKLKPDMFAVIHVSRPALRVAVVPAPALLHEGTQTFVIVQKAKDSFEKRQVQVEKTGPQEVLLRSGLQPGDTVVTSGAELIREAAK